MVFSAPNDPTQSPVRGGIGGGVRRAASGGPHEAGQAIERVFATLGHRTDGLRETARDSQDRNNTLTHHYGEFLATGFRLGAPTRALAQNHVDGPENPGDRRVGYFASTVGQALRDARLTTTDATRLATWALTESSGNPFIEGTATRFNSVQIADYVTRFNAVHPDAQITLAPPPRTSADTWPTQPTLR